jgi:hypothetical protein
MCCSISCWSMYAFLSEEAADPPRSVRILETVKDEDEKQEEKLCVL